jgi:hypothetical protein
MRSSVVVILYSGSHRQQLPREIIHPCNLFHPSMILNIHSNDSIPSAHCPWCNARGSLICAHGLLFMPCSRPTAHKIATLFESGCFFFCVLVVGLTSRKYVSCFGFISLCQKLSRLSRHPFPLRSEWASSGSCYHVYHL